MMDYFHLLAEDLVKRRCMEQQHELYSGRDRVTIKKFLHRRRLRQCKVMNWHFVLLIYLFNKTTIIIIIMCLERLFWLLRLLNLIYNAYGAKSGTYSNRSSRATYRENGSHGWSSSCDCCCTCWTSWLLPPPLATHQRTILSRFNSKKSLATMNSEWRDAEIIEIGTGPVPSSKITLPFPAPSFVYVDKLLLCIYLVPLLSFFFFFLLFLFTIQIELKITGYTSFS